MPEVRDAWLKIGLCTDPIDQAQAREAARRAYRCAGRPEPDRFFFVDSPLGGVLAAHVLSCRAGITVPNTNTVEIPKQVVESVARGLDCTAAALRKEIKKYGDPSRDFASHFLFGQHDAGWLSFYAFCKEDLGLAEEVKELDGLMQCAKTMGWWAPYDTTAIIQERHRVIKRDDDGRLHCPDGPSVAYADGFECFFWRGLRISRKIIMEPESIAVGDIDAERNAEIRRVMVERYGMERYVRDSNAKLVHEDSWGKLYRKEQTRDEAIQMVELVNSTPEPDGSFKNYMLRVPPTITTAKAAAAWLSWKDNPADYNPEAQT